jgi:hypothetical protein
MKRVQSFCIILISSLSFCLISSCQSAPPSQSAKSAESAAQEGYAFLTPRVLKPHLEFLASDELEAVSYTHLTLPTKA